jgi:integrase
LYAGDWAAFVAWCHAAGATPLPADPATIAAYLSAAASTLGPGAMARRLAAIADRHRGHGLVARTADPAVKAILRAARRGATPRRDPPPTAALLARMAAGCPGDLAGLRDRALLLLMEATGLGRAALVGLDAENLRFTGAGAELRREGEGAWATKLSRHPDLARCPARALETWLLVSDTRFGPVFRKIDRWGNIEYRRLGADAVRRILARRAPRRPRRGDTARAADPMEPA